MDDSRQCIDLVAVDQHIELDNVGRAELLELVVRPVLGVVVSAMMCSSVSVLPEAGV